MARNFASGNYLEVPSNAAFDGSVGTLAFWFKMTSSTSNTMLASRQSSSSRSGIAVSINNGGTGRIQAYAYDASTQRVTLHPATTGYNDGIWHHIAFVFDRTTAANSNKLYIDGALAVQATSSAAWSFGANPVRVGKPTDSFWGNFVGDIAEACWWSQQLTADEIAALANRVSPQKVRPAALELHIPCWA